MAKFKMNDVVAVKATGQRGTVMCREEVCDKDTKHTVVSYLVKLGEGFENYRKIVATVWRKSFRSFFLQ